jgi:hypothetical protein
VATTVWWRHQPTRSGVVKAGGKPTSNFATNPHPHAATPLACSSSAKYSRRQSITNVEEPEGDFTLARLKCQGEQDGRVPRVARH